MTCGALSDERLQARFQVDVVSAVVRRAQVGQRRGILRRQRLTEGLERIQRHDPRRNGGAEIFREKRPERLVFPRLHIARAPVVHQDEPEDVLLGPLDRDRLAERVSGPDEETPSPARNRSSGSARRPAWSHPAVWSGRAGGGLRAADHDRTGAPVIARRAAISSSASARSPARAAWCRRCGVMMEE